MSKFYKRKSEEEKQKEVEVLIDKANKKIENIFNTPNDIKEYLSFMAKFYNYSFRNSILIQQQFRGAIAVGSYAFWKEKGFTVNKGERGIGILVPVKLSDYFKNKNGQIVSVNKATREEKELIKKAKIEVFKGALTYQKGYVFEISQTNATEKDLPKIFPNKFLDGKIEDYNIFYKALENIADKIGTKIIEPKLELGVAKGVSYKVTKEVALNPRNSEVENIKTLIHELAHSKLHRMDNLDEHTRAEREYQAEMTAYAVTSYFNIDREDNSLRYIKNWSENISLDDKKRLLRDVKETSKEFIEIIEETLKEELSVEMNKTDNSFFNTKGDENIMSKETTQKEIEKMVKEHEEWINTKGERGRRLDLEGKELKGIRLLNVDLENANFKNTVIKDSAIFANLKGANFEGSKIDNTEFLGSNIKGVKMGAKELEIINTQIKEEEILNKEANKILKTNKNKSKEKAKDNTYEQEI
ncbi:ImmA/IrrE family metallo-endopeptidase [Clostridium sardiniense]|uniref:ImmA/IrrE family metallo-endopeptidase n=1 Tax=Clostridium sardiniense TaxID=29369 RepID=A0ABS7KZP9_CLOSR|nr:ImmA/IrrE family metallo-endopeptidase [Clostridium sardiniense]MBY0756284.1 ImmA/IrrE family metallo-endopeptidase [Clostridium sardiniense]MDQ0458501.1 uncharacterized protein YjbI with pentapeptide repeats [Clostridium sardiniense]